MTTAYEVTGFDRPSALYEFASNCGIHVSSMDKLTRFAVELQRRAHITQKEEKEVSSGTD